VRVDDPERDIEKLPRSPWRLYYTNTTTGLIDRIVSEVQGRRITAEISSWSESNGERVPTQVTWKGEGRIIMQYSATSFSLTTN
jgi:hypothetical protein